MLVAEVVRIRYRDKPVRGALLYGGKSAVQSVRVFDRRRNARAALEQLPNLKDCQVHTSVMLSEVDIKTFKRLGVDLTCEPVISKKKLTEKI